MALASIAEVGILAALGAVIPYLLLQRFHSAALFYPKVSISCGVVKNTFAFRTLIQTTILELLFINNIRQMEEGSVLG